MKLYKILILGATAAAGTVYYQRYIAVSNLAAAYESEPRPIFFSSKQPNNGIGKVGGIGPVGTKTIPRRQEQRHAP